LESLHTKQLPLELRELEKVARKAKRMFTRKKFRKPVATDRQYREPQKKANYKDVCRSCGRITAYGSTHCRECFQKEVRAKYDAKVRTEDERVKTNEAAFLNVMKGMEMKTPKKLPSTPITRSTSGLRTALFEEMEALRNGTSNAQRARSVAMMANSILQSVQVEIEYHKYVNANKGRIDGEQKVVQLGTDISLAA
jgi:ribosomal protein L40E